MKTAKVIPLPVHPVDGSWRRRFLSSLRLAALSTLAYLIICLLKISLRWRAAIYEADLEELKKRPFILAFWHCHLALPIWWYKSFRSNSSRRMTVIISAHGDGRIIAGAMQKLGLEVVTGSSSRGGVRALSGLIRAAAEGSDLTVTPDGPRGPAQQVKRGVVDLAMHTGLPIVPLAFQVTNAWRIKSWDKMIIPKPFAKAWFRIGAPIQVPKHASLGEREEVARELAAVLNRLGGQNAD